VRGRDLAGFLAEARPLMAQAPYDHQRIGVEWGGQFENLQRAQSRLALILPMTLGIMLVLLFGEFGNLRQPALVLLAVPLAMRRPGRAAPARHDAERVERVGFIALFGVAVLNAVLMLAQINRLRREDGWSLRDAVLEGAREPHAPGADDGHRGRLRPDAGHAGHGPGQRRAAPAGHRGGGRPGDATALTLLLLPALYYLIEARQAARHGTAEGEPMTRFNCILRACCFRPRCSYPALPRP
jgi:cobalt-zinc-cadmium resistance protein CzcA